ncbi:MAG: hypothetical protein LRY71_06455 [Bacillaceae bacterium]|nr:hypothetical protein [Bacillaceae bacterium]
MKNKLLFTLCVCCLIFQVVLFCLFSIVFSSTIESMPWYEPLTVGAFFAMILFTPFQLFVSGILYLIYKKLVVCKNIAVISIIQSGIIIANLLIIFVIGNFLTSISFVSLVAQVLLGICFIAVSVKMYWVRIFN